MKTALTRRDRTDSFWSLVFLSSAATALLLSTVGQAVAAGPDCAQASQALDRAQQALSKAVRDVDTSASAYASCMEKGGNCANLKSAYDAALVAKAKALAAHKTAASQRQAACQ